MLVEGQRSRDPEMAELLGGGKEVWKPLPVVAGDWDPDPEPMGGGVDRRERGVVCGHPLRYDASSSSIVGSDARGRKAIDEDQIDLAIAWERASDFVRVQHENSASANEQT